MSAPNASSSSSQLVSYAQDIDYTHTEGFKQFKAKYNVKNARAAVEFGCLRVVNWMSYLTVGSLENTSRLVDVSLNWTINSTG